MEYFSTKKYFRLTDNQTIAFCSIVYQFLDSKYLFIDLDFDALTTLIK